MKPSIFFGFSFLHHGPHTAFRGLATALSDQRVIDITPDILARVPPRLARPLLWRWLEWNEWRLYPYFREGGRVIHYFFPENTLRHGHRWKGDNRLLVTLHQPPDRMELMMRDPHYDRLTEGIRAADGIVVQSDSHREPFQTLFPGIPVHYIPLGVAAGHYRRRLPLRRPADGPPRILTVGNWLRDYALWAKTVRVLHERHPGIEFRVVANPGILEEARAELGSHPARVHYLRGLTDDELMREYETCNVFYLPLTDAMANDALLEALSLGVPSVVTDLPATRDYAGDEGMVFIPRGELDPAVAAIEDLLASPERAAALGARARTRAETHFDWPIMAEAYRQLYRRIAGQRPA